MTNPRPWWLTMPAAELAATILPMVSVSQDVARRASDDKHRHVVEDSGLTRLGMHALQTDTVRRHLGLSGTPPTTPTPAAAAAAATDRTPPRAQCRVRIMAPPAVRCPYTAIRTEWARKCWPRPTAYDRATLAAQARVAAVLQPRRCSMAGRIRSLDRIRLRSSAPVKPPSRMRAPRASPQR